MTTSLAIILLVGFMFNSLFKKLKLPGLLGMLLLGVIIGPKGFNMIDQKILDISIELREMALIIILLRVGFDTSSKDLKDIGGTALKLSFIPGILEGLTIAFFSTILLDFTFIQGGILGFIIAAVSPAVVVPLMLNLSEKGIGGNKKIPTLILASTSIDDVVAITIFSSFLALYTGSNPNLLLSILDIPVSIILGILLGLLIGFVLVQFFKHFSIRDTYKVLIILCMSILLMTIEDLLVLHTLIHISGLLGVMSIGFAILELRGPVADRLAIRFKKLWLFAEILLFVLVGSQVDISVMFDAGLIGLVIIILGLVSRSIGVLISTLRSNLDKKEKLFLVMSFTPKATVQAAIGIIPLTMGVLSGDVILAISVLSIVVTAPIGSTLIQVFSKRLLYVPEDHISENKKILES